MGIVTDSGVIGPYVFRSRWCLWYQPSQQSSDLLTFENLRPVGWALSFSPRGSSTTYSFVEIFRFTTQSHFILIISYVTER